MGKQIHTPGPWHIEPLQDDEGESIAICKAGLGVIAVIEGGNNPAADGARTQGFSYDVDQANARLIAAAPEILEALKLLEGMIEETGDNKHDLAAARAAIAKAEGAA